MMLAAIGVVGPHIPTGRVRLLATAGPRRIPSFPDTPTLVESGYPDVVVIGWIGLLAPAGTPPDILDKLSRDVGRQLMSADVRSGLAATGRDLTPSSPQAFGAFIRAESDKWSRVIRAVGLEHTQ